MWIVKLALRRPYTFVVVALLILLLGVTSIRNTPTDIFPEIDIPVVTVVWQYTGLSPDQMAKQITTFSEYTISFSVDNVKNIEIAASKFREKGILGASLKDLLSLAGVSQGSFYYHFLSKEHLVREAVVSALDHQRGIWELALKEGSAGFEGEVRRRLSQDYRDRPEQDCPRATLAAEIARHSKETRLEIEQKADQLLQLLADNLPGPKTRAKRQEAIAIYALMIGILQLSRVAASPRLSAEILESGRAHVIEQLRRRVDTNSGTMALTVEQPTPSGKHQTHTEL